MNLKSLIGFGKRKKLEELNESENDSNEDGVIGEYCENDLPVIVKFDSRLPEELMRAQLPMLTVISWSYDGSQRNGMPPIEVNQRMIELEETIENGQSKHMLFKYAYSRTGNNSKELIYYSRSQETFMHFLNKTLSNHERYPIEVNFYEDKEWLEFKKLLDDFKTSDKN